MAELLTVNAYECCPHPLTSGEGFSCANMQHRVCVELLAAEGYGGEEAIMKVAELKGHLLDDWVARSHGWTKYLDDKNIWWWRQKVIGDTVGILQTQCDAYQPSADWNTGGQLLDDGGIFVVKSERPPGLDLEVPAYLGKRSNAPEGDGQMVGNTYLEAAMRTFVFLRFGYEVDDAPDWGVYAQPPEDRK